MNAEPRRLDHFVAVTPKLRAQVIGHDPQDVGRASDYFDRSGTDGRKHQQYQQQRQGETVRNKLKTGDNTARYPDDGVGKKRRLSPVNWRAAKALSKSILAEIALTPMLYDR